ncbi:unnamed protein product [Calypogeia fissa]
MEYEIDWRGSSMDSNQMSLAYEERMFDMKEGRGGRIGCTLVTGFLGCGKTTLLQHILKNRGNLQICVLVNEFAEVDVDSLVLDSARINSSHGMTCVSLADGCACCAKMGDLKETVRSAMSSKHNFDYVVIETSGLANPLKIAEQLEETGIRLDLVVTVVDVESLDTILKIPVALQQLAMADIVLINKCDLASLGEISDAEDRVEQATLGTKAVRCRFSNVPLDLVLNVTLPDPAPSLGTTTANSSEGFLSHEVATPIFGREFPGGGLRQGAVNGHEALEKNIQKREARVAELGMQLSQLGVLHEHEHDPQVVSRRFSSHVPMCLAAFQDFVVCQLRSSHALLRAKGVVWFEESRSIRYFFHFSGQKRSEVVYAGPWESQAQTDLVFIGRDTAELELLRFGLSEATVHHDTGVEALQPAITLAEEFARLVSSDPRFKVHNSRPRNVANGLSDMVVQTMVVFGLVGSSLRGVHEGDLNASLMQTVNGRGLIFLSRGSSLREGGWLQLSFGGTFTPQAAWCEIQTAATGVISKAFREICPCRCDMIPEMHSHHAGEH